MKVSFLFWLIRVWKCPGAEGLICWIVAIIVPIMEIGFYHGNLQLSDSPLKIPACINIHGFQESVSRLPKLWR